MDDVSGTEVAPSTLQSPDLPPGKAYEWGDKRRRRAARQSIPHPPQVTEYGTFPVEDEFGCALCTTYGDHYVVRCIEIDEVFWPMCRTCQARLDHFPTSEWPRVIDACGKLAMSARSHGVVFKPAVDRPDDVECDCFACLSQCGEPCECDTDRLDLDDDGDDQ